MNEIIKLSNRLLTVASFVRQGSRIADIGTDHGYIPVYLAQTGKIVSALAMDVRMGPLERATEHVQEYKKWAEDRQRPLCPVELRLSDGLQALKPGEADTVIIAGMGGELELRILLAGCALWEDIRHWILSPQSDLDKVRRFLAEHGFAIQKEAMVKEDGKYYTIMDVSRGVMSYENQAQYLYGKCLIDSTDATLGAYLEREEKRVEAILAALSPGDGASLTEAQRQARQSLLEEMTWIKEAQHEMQRDN